MTGVNEFTKSGGIIAPYRRFRPSPQFYTNVFTGGTYCADIIGCPWTCDHCWSAFGWTHDPSQARFELTPEQVVSKLVAGMVRNGAQAGRISGGEATMYWNTSSGSSTRSSSRRREATSGSTGGPPRRACR